MLGYQCSQDSKMIINFLLLLKPSLHIFDVIIEEKQVYNKIMYNIFIVSISFNMVPRNILWLYYWLLPLYRLYTDIQRM